MLRFASFPEETPRRALHRAAFWFANRPVQSGPAAPTSCRSGASFAVRLAHRLRPWLQYFWKPTDLESPDFHFERTQPAP